MVLSNQLTVEFAPITGVAEDDEPGSSRLQQMDVRLTKLESKINDMAANIEYIVRAMDRRPNSMRESETDRINTKHTDGGSWKDDPFDLQQGKLTREQSTIVAKFGTVERRGANNDNDMDTLETNALSKDDESRLFTEYICQRRYMASAAQYCRFPDPFPMMDPNNYDPHETMEALEGYQYLQAYIFHFMHNDGFTKGSHNFELCIYFFIILSAVTFIFSTIEAIKSWNGWDIIDYVVTAVFSVEYLARILNVKNKVRYIIQPLNMVDLVAVLPLYIEVAFGIKGAALRVLRVVRLIRVCRLKNLVNEWSEILVDACIMTATTSSGIVSLILLMEVSVFSSLVYVAEQGHGSGFDNIPVSMYWAFVTITTVGYGDLYPVSTVGRLLACVTMFTGLLVIACVVIMFGGNFETAKENFERAKSRWREKHVLRIDRKKHLTDFIE